ncbi:glycosyltransferase family 39 protein, partial [Candidatus Woesearchaeota archaeon]|nr:glycosyltransferase family 39 protein [Candidatus Woesearchaeota archaeon]
MFKIKNFCKTSLPLVAILCFAFIMRLIFSNFMLIMGSDSAGYILIAKKIFFEHHFFAYHFGNYILFRQPAYPILIGIFNLFFNNLELAAKLVSITLGTLIIIPTYLFTKKFYDDKVAIAASLLIAIYPVLITDSISIMSEATYTLFYLIAIFVGFYSIKKESPKLFFITGLIMALAYLTRVQGFINPFVMAGIILVWFRSLKKFFLYGFPLLIGFLLLSSPFLFYLHNITGSWTPDGHNSFSGGYVPASIEGTFYEEYASREPQPEYVSVLQKIFRMNTISGFRQLYEEYLPSLLPVLVIILISLGMFSNRWNKQIFFREGYFLVWFFSLSTFYASIWNLARYYTIFIPIFLIYAAKGVIMLKHKLKLPQTLIFVILLISFIPSYLLLPQYILGGYEHFEWKEAGEWLKKSGETNISLLTMKPQIYFYAGSEGRFYAIPPRMEYNEII